MKITKFKDIPLFISDGVYQVNYPLPSLVKWVEDEIEEMNLQLNPEFQRGHVWTEAQQIAWIEYHLRGGKSGNTIYFNHPLWFDQKEPKPGQYADYVCVDGLQRITAATRFIHNEIPAFETYYKDFEDKFRVLTCNMLVCVNDLKTEREVLQWYLDMNAGGTPHSDAELEKVRKMMREM